MQKGLGLMLGTRRNRGRWYCGQLCWAAAAVVVAVTISTVVHAGTSNRALLVPVSGPVVWSRIPDPTKPGKFLESFVGAGGVVVSIPAAGRGERHVTWTFPGLGLGYYRVSLQYPGHAGNASSVLVQKKTSKDAAFVTWKTRLDQRLGDGVTTPSNSFVKMSKNITPFATNNATTYIWVDADVGSTSKGTLQIRLSDSGCYSGRIVADSVTLEFISGVK